MRRGLGAAVAALVVVAGCGGRDEPPDGVAVEDAWARTTPGGVTVGAVYLRVTSDAADQLTGADVDPAIAARVQVHRTETSADGTASMEGQDALAVPAGGELVLEPIGDHLMLVDLAGPLVRGASFDITLHFAEAGERVVAVDVRDDAP